MSWMAGSCYVIFKTVIVDSAVYIVLSWWYSSVVGSWIWQSRCIRGKSHKDYTTSIHPSIVDHTHCDNNRKLRQVERYYIHIYRHILIASPASHQCTTMHISHPTMALTMAHLHSFNGIIQSSQNQTLSYRVPFHYLHITAMSALLPSDRTLKITLNNTIHPLTSPRTTSVPTPYHFHLYLNLHDSLPYLQYTRDVNKYST